MFYFYLFITPIPSRHSLIFDWVIFNKMVKFGISVNSLHTRDEFGLDGVRRVRVRVCTEILRGDSGSTQTVGTGSVDLPSVVRRLTVRTVTDRVIRDGVGV